MEAIRIDYMINILEAKKDYIADHSPMNDVSNGQMVVLGQIIEFLKLEASK